LLIDEIYGTVPAESIAWISLGALRMSPELKDVMRARFPNSFLPLGELVPSADGKLRYVKPIRIKMYQSLMSWIGRRSSLQTKVYACMERPEVWSRVFGRSVPANEEVGDKLAKVVLQT
jgi:spore photoproduct lyase